MASIEQLSKKIKEQESEIYRLNNIIGNLPEIVYWKDKSGKYLGINNILISRLGLPSLSPNEIVGKTDYDLFPKEIADGYRANDLEVMTTGKEIVKEEIAFTSDGKKIFQLSAKKPLRGQNGEITGTVGFTINITELKEFEEKLRLAKEAAEVANARIKAMAGSIAHELRTPLGAIGMNLGCVEGVVPELPEEINEMVGGSCHEIRKELKSANTIIDMLLMNIREQLDLEKDKIEACSINDCVEEALRRYPFVDNQKEKVEWIKSDDYVFKGNSTFMQHVLFNLLKNALIQINKAGKGEITIWTEKEKNGFSLHFKDTASGVPKDILPHLFERFFSRTKNGTGLGLAFCKMVIESFGGTITCQSEEGKYTEFVMEFLG